MDIAIAAFIVNLVFAVMPAVKRFGKSLPSMRTVTVSAEGKVTISPDIAETSFGVVSRGQDPVKLADDNNKKVTAAIEFLKKQGIEVKDIKTVGYNLNTEYDWTAKERKILGYILTQTVGVKIRDLNKAAAIIGGLTPLGVNEVSGISFSIDDPEKYLTEARAEAFKKAQEKAAAMATSNGVSIGKVLNISEYGGAPPMPYYYGKGGPMMAEVARDVAAPSIEPGSQEVRVSVTVTYELN